MSEQIKTETTGDNIPVVLTPQERFDKYNAGFLVKEVNYVYALIKYPYIEYEDLLQVARGALWEACVKFDSTKGVTGWEYFSKCVRGHLLAYCRKYKAFEKVPLSIDSPIESEARDTDVMEKRISDILPDKDNKVDDYDDDLIPTIVSTYYKYIRAHRGANCSLIQDKNMNRVKFLINGIAEGKSVRSLATELGLSDERCHQILRGVGRTLQQAGYWDKKYGRQKKRPV